MTAGLADDTLYSTIMELKHVSGSLLSPPIETLYSTIMELKQYIYNSFTISSRTLYSTIMELKPKKKK